MQRARTRLSWVFPVDFRSAGRATASRQVRAQWFHARNHFYGSSITANDFIWGKFSKFRICISYVILQSGFRGSMFLFWKICWHVSHIGKYSESTDSGGTGTAGCCSCIRGHFDGPPKRVACARVSITLAWKFSSWQFWSARTAWYFLVFSMQKESQNQGGLSSLLTRIKEQVK